MPKKPKNELEAIKETPLDVPAPASESMALMQMIERVAINPDADVTKMEKLLDMKLRIMGIEAEQKFNDAMTAAQGEMGPIKANETNTHTKSNYASYADLDKALRPIYVESGFSISFNGGEGAEPGYQRIICYVSHSGGHTRTYQTDMPADGKGPQGNDVMSKTHAAGAAFTYGQRYLLKLIFNVAIGELDNDGNPPDVLIDDERVKRLQDLASELEVDVPALCDVFKIGSLKEVTESNYYKIVGMIEEKRTRKETK